MSLATFWVAQVAGTIGNRFLFAIARCSGDVFNFARRHVDDELGRVVGDREELFALLQSPALVLPVGELLAVFLIARRFPSHVPNVT